jgi:hypothetical protein
MGMSLEEFNELEPRQYHNKVKGHIEQFNEGLENDLRNTRSIMFMIARGYQVKHNKIKKPTDIFTLPSEEVKNERPKPLSNKVANEIAKKWQ